MSSNFFLQAFNLLQDASGMLGFFLPFIIMCMLACMLKESVVPIGYCSLYLDLNRMKVSKTRQCNALATKIVLLLVPKHHVLL